MKKLAKGEVLILRTCAPDGSSYGGKFKWPKSGPVKCEDFEPLEGSSYELSRMRKTGVRL